MRDGCSQILASTVNERRKNAVASRSSMHDAVSRVKRAWHLSSPLQTTSLVSKQPHVSTGTANAHLSFQRRDRIPDSAGKLSHIAWRFTFTCLGQEASQAQQASSGAMQRLHLVCRRKCHGRYFGVQTAQDLARLNCSLANSRSDKMAPATSPSP